jgi:hypothetical protein
LSKLDFNAGYYQGWVAAEDIEKMAFVGPDGLWEWLVVQQGISTAPAWFMRMVASVLKEHMSKDYAVVFMDDISIYSDSAKEHEIHVRAVMDTLRKHNFKLISKKKIMRPMNWTLLEALGDLDGSLICLALPYYFRSFRRSFPSFSASAYRLGIDSH